MPNVRLTNSLLNALTECGDCDGAEKICHKIEKSVMGYGNWMSRFNDAERAKRTLAFYPKMKMSATTANEVIEKIENKSMKIYASMVRRLNSRMFLHMRMFVGRLSQSWSSLRSSRSLDGRVRIFPPTTSSHAS